MRAKAHTAAEAREIEAKLQAADRSALQTLRGQLRERAKPFARKAHKVFKAAGWLWYDRNEKGHAPTLAEITAQTYRLIDCAIEEASESESDMFGRIAYNAQGLRVTVSDGSYFRGSLELSLQLEEVCGPAKVGPEDL